VHAAWLGAAPGRAVLGARGPAAIGAVGEVVYRLFWSPNSIWLACAERDDAPDRIVRGNAHGYPIAWNHLDAKAAHTAAQLRQHFMSGVALHAVKTAAMDRHDRALHVNQIVLAQSASIPFPSILNCDTENIWSSNHLVLWSSLANWLKLLD
jgi:hypothetical protein